MAKILLIIEFNILLWGILAIGIASCIIRSQELKINKEWQDGLKTHVVYKDCLQDDEKIEGVEYESE